MEPKTSYFPYLLAPAICCSGPYLIALGYGPRPCLACKRPPTVIGNAMQYYANATASRQPVMELRVRGGVLV